MPANHICYWPFLVTWNKDWARHTELILYGGLSRRVSAAEKLATFLYQCCSSSLIRIVKNRWQHSADTISRYGGHSNDRSSILLPPAARNFHQVLNALVSQGFFKCHVHLPPDECPGVIRDNPKLYPYFKDVRATVDGSLFPGHFSATLHPRYRCRKGL